ncbi:AGE family epimerase/isomerase [Rhodopseudomonas telluris]|uniref:AGE family epimerase/isomerase n=1 Tax=Rhodopseudomonas telluris TaxID=644215 RepID=A0ABV6ENB6_9BRAD
MIAFLIEWMEMQQPCASKDECDIVATLKSTIIEHALPLWSGVGWDDTRGGFVERLDQFGRPDLDATRRVRVQARQIYCFAKAAQCGWYPEGRALALKGLDYLLSKAKGRDGKPGYVHTLGPDGTTLDSRRDCYDHAFVLLALSNVYALDQDAQVRGEIDELTAFLDGPMRSESGGYRESLPDALPRRQNPHMHLLEAMIAAFDATGDVAFRNLAGELFALFTSRFYDQQRCVLGEYFETDWTMIEPVCVEPGHQAEWTWLLKEYQRISGHDTAAYREQLLTSTLRYQDASGCLVDEGNAEGVITKSTRRCWPQTELAKAWLAQAQHGVAGAEQAARTALQSLYSNYLCHPVRGGWYDQFDQSGRSLVDAVPASTFYHVFCAVHEAEQVLG